MKPHLQRLCRFLGLALPALVQLAILAAVCLQSANLAFADNWPAWRGPEGTGHCRERGLPLKWSVAENVRWKVPLPGPGNSTPVIWGHRIFLTQATHPARSSALNC
jgi:hypothetical protein